MRPVPYQSMVGPREMSEYFLTSGRLGFRHWRQADEPLALALWTDPMVTRFIANRPIAGHEALLRLNREICTQASRGIQYWPIFLLEGDVSGAAASGRGSASLTFPNSACTCARTTGDAA